MDDKHNFPAPRPQIKSDRGPNSSKAGVYLTLVVPPGRRKYMCRILKPVVRDIRGLAFVLDVTERADRSEQQEGSQRSNTPSYTVSSQELSAPALAVMLFLPEHSHTSADVTAVRQKFQQFPWRYHHAIQLQSATSSPSLLGQQDFYFLSRQLPLWSVSAGIQQSGARVRFNIFTHRFSAMVEFYRLITNSEMESRKAGFCLFPLTPEHPNGQSSFSSCSENNSSTSIICELALKHCPLVNPFPLSDAHLSFPVNNLESLLNILPTQARCLSKHHYLIHDPDGNSLILFDSKTYPRPANVIQGTSTTLPATNDHNHTQLAMDKSSEHEFSIDSGRYSDFETSSFELETCMSKMVEEVDLLKNGSFCDSSTTSRDYSLHASGQSGRKLAKLERRENKCHHSPPSHCICPRFEPSTPHQPDLNCEVDKTYLCNNRKCTCNNLCEHNSHNGNQTFTTTEPKLYSCGRSEQLHSCKIPRPNLPDQQFCLVQKFKKNVFVADIPSDNRCDFSETEL
ncbi:hypothetical protein RRG08_024806 [Elysia crispata]|uniref:FAM124 domain-containing protein n=1 Tax=Elysia crispata TaxID=231223 RepID=A0AAE0YJ86_9GAST|nr:hypothetical protein RRG08_024806 [Elysia crispata]